MSKNVPLLLAEKRRLVEAIRNSREDIPVGEPCLSLGFKTEDGVDDTAIRVSIPRLLGLILAGLDDVKKV